MQGAAGSPGRPRSLAGTGWGSERGSQPQSIPERPGSGVQDEPGARLPKTLALEGRGWTAKGSWDREWGATEGKVSSYSLPPTRVAAPRGSAPAAPPGPRPPPAPARRASLGRQGLQHRLQVAPDPGLWEAGNGNQEVTEERGAGGKGGAGARGGGAEVTRGGRGLCGIRPSGLGVLIGRRGLGHGWVGD